VYRGLTQAEKVGRIHTVGFQRLTKAIKLFSVMNRGLVHYISGGQRPVLAPVQLQSVVQQVMSTRHVYLPVVLGALRCAATEADSIPTLIEDLSCAG
jgi:hypothetical protein